MPRSRNLYLLILLASLSGVASAEEPIAPIKAPFPMPQLTRPTIPDQTVDLRDFDAIGDGKTLCTKAFADAIQACSEKGGGRVLVPRGVWLTGPIHLKSNIELHLDRDAELRFSRRFEDYLPVVLVQRGGVQCYTYSPLIYAIDCENIAITGQGTLNGQGEKWWKFKKNQPGMTHLFSAPAKGIPVEKRVYDSPKDGVRPPFLQTFRCKNVLLEGFTVKKSPSWCVHPVYCENVVIRKLRLLSREGPNGDGIDPDSCKNVLIEHCYFSCGDDCIILKAGRDEEAWQLGIPCENIVVRHCTMHTGHAGFGVGSEMSAGVRNVFVHDCDIEGSENGIRMKSCRGRGGIVENLWIEDIRIGPKTSNGAPKDYQRPLQCAIQISLVYPTDSATKTPPVFRNFHFRNITGGNGYPYALRILGLPESKIENVHFEDINLTARKAIEIDNAKGLVFEKFKVRLQKP